MGLFLFIGGCSKKGKLIHLTGRTMGTQYNVKYYDGPVKHSSVEILKKINERLEDINRQMSTYIKLSQISFFNSQDRQGWVSVDPDFNKVLNFSLTLAKKTKGSFDPTIGPLVNLWGFGPEGKRRVPSKSEIQSAILKVGFDKVEHDFKNSKIRKLKPGVYLDLSASAKGHGVDEVAILLKENGAKDLMVEIGGEVRAEGKKDKSLWKIGISTPDPKNLGQEIQKVLPLENLSVATSGNYRNFFEKDGKNYSHTIDFKTGKPVDESLASVSVVSRSGCMEADALATALMAMGRKKALEFAEEQKIAAYFIYKAAGQKGSVFDMKESAAFKKLFP
tara:strand:+ start:180478 stop:181479 length:1002 start_codon:yes stop_codon:yes gene_type:complete